MNMPKVTKSMPMRRGEPLGWRLGLSTSMASAAMVAAEVKGKDCEVDDELRHSGSVPLHTFRERNGHPSESRLKVFALLHEPVPAEVLTLAGTSRYNANPPPMLS